MSNDQLHRYLFEQCSVRGELVQLSGSFQSLIKGKPYPVPVANLLGELMAATSLLSATLKFNGSITVQIQGDGPISLLVINGNNNQVMRGTARWDEEKIIEGSLQQLLGKGHMVITIEPEQGERYQGIVALEQETLAACLEDYFARSEQLATKIWLRASAAAENAVAAGMLLQVLPSDEDNTAEFEHLAQLTNTIKDEELFELDAQEMLYRLYHQEEVKLYPPLDIRFKCNCSRERSAMAITAIAQTEVEAMLSENPIITLHCDYCGTDYLFDKVDVSALFSAHSSTSNKTLH